MPKFLLKNTAPYLISLFLLIVAQHFQQKNHLPEIKINKQSSSLNFKSSFYNFFSFGLKRSFSSFMWVQTLLTLDTEHYKGQDLSSWTFLRFKTITDLNPLMLVAYEFGGPYLSVAKDDIHGAKFIYERGLRYFPRSNHLLYFSGMNYYLEFKNYEKSYELFEKIESKSKFKILTLPLMSKIKRGEGDLGLALKLLNMADEATDNIFLKKLYQKRIKEMELEINKSCQSKKHSYCNEKINNQ